MLKETLPWTWVLLALPLLAGWAWAEQPPGAVDQALREELERLGGKASPHKRQNVKLVDATVKVEPFNIGKDFKPCADEFPPSVTNLSINGGNYCRDGKPVFLFGVETRGHQGGWLLKTLGIDWEEYPGVPGFRAAITAAKGTGSDGKPQLTLKVSHDDPLGEARLREALRSGTMVSYDYALAMQNFWLVPHLEYRIHPEFYTPHLDGWRKCSSHFLDLNLENPEAKQLYLNILRHGNQYTRKFPILLREIANEVSYINPSAENIAAFQRSTANKYITIEKANAAWKTKFADFSKVIPPINLESACLYNSDWGVIPHGKELSTGLWIDWLKFMQENGMARLAELAADYKVHNPKAVCTFQTPYWPGVNAHTPSSIGAISDVYGQEVGLSLVKLEKGKEDWNSIRSMLEQALSTDLVASVNPDKPSVNLECCCLGYPKGQYRVGAAGMRTFFWNQAVHGAGGSVISYFYSQSTSDGGWSVWDPTRMSLDAIREMPRVKREIQNVAEIVLPRPRIKGRVALLFSHESCRVLRPEADSRFGKVVPEICDFYGAALFSGVPLDVLDNGKLLREDLGRYAAVVIPRAPRVLPGTLEKLAKYAEAGGALIVSSDSLKIDDELHTPLDVSALLGGKPGEAVTKGEAIAFDAPELGSGEPAGLLAAPADGLDDFDKTVFGFRFSPAAAKVLAKAGTEPALAVNTLGRGKVYYLARELGGASLCKLMAWMLREAGAKSDLQAELTDGLATNYVETHLYQRDSHAVVYAINWGGGPRSARLKVRQDLPGQSFLVRSLRTREFLKPDGSAGKAEWSKKDLEQGIAAELPSQDPLLFVIDDAAKGELPLEDISPQQKDALSWLWRTSPKADKRVVFDVMYSAEGRIHGYKMPTAAKLLEDRGYQVEYLCAPIAKMQVRNNDEVRKADLSEFNVLIVSGAHGGSFEDADLKSIQRFVEQGGGLLYCVLRDWHTNPQQKVIERFGVKAGHSFFYDPDNSIANEPLWINFADIAEHPIAKDVKKVVCMGARPLSGKGSPVVRSSAKSWTAHTWGDARKDGPQTLVQALEVGKGRVVAIGTDVLFRPDDLELADNKKLFQNIIDWLAEPSPGKAGAAKATEQKSLPEAPAVTKSNEMAVFWNFETGAGDFEKASVKEGFAYTGKASAQAATVAGKSYDFVLQTKWNKAGYAAIPADPHINFAYHTDGEQEITIVVESPDKAAQKRLKLKPGKWTFVSLPLKQFEKASDSIAGQPLTEIQLKGGEPGAGGTLFIDDLSISSGPVKPGR